MSDTPKFVMPTPLAEPAPAAPEPVAVVSESAEPIAPEALDAVRAPLKQYTSHPVVKFAIGNFQFDNAKLDLFTQEDVDAFEAELEWLAKNQPVTRRMVKTLDLETANRIAASFRAAAHQGGSDTSMIRAGLAVGAAMQNAGEVK